MVVSFFRRFLSKRKRLEDRLGSFDPEAKQVSSVISDRTRRREFNKQIDSGINLVELRPVRQNILGIIKKRLSGDLNGNFEQVINGVMKEFVFNDNDFDYDDIAGVVNYFGRLSYRGNLTGENRKTLETARTVFSHLSDYVSLNNGHGSFKKYLFGEQGVLTQRRLKDFKNIRLAVNEPEKFGKLEENTNYVFDKGSDERFNRFNLSYTRSDESGDCFVRINDKDSKGMYSNNGMLYWGSFDKMFDNVNTRKTINFNLKNSLKRANNSLYNSKEGNFYHRVD
tara:strand:- start:1183 stop:2028 length:846 start_codon:yes stop_codon:yes gene_type:complete